MTAALEEEFVFMRLVRLTLCCLISLSVLGVSAQSAAEDDCPESQFTTWGASGVVTPGDSNNVRAEPSTDAALVGRVAAGDPFNVLYDHIACADGYLWREIVNLTVQGWTVERAADGGDPFIVPYEPELREVGQRTDDGSVRVEESGIAFTVPAALGYSAVTALPEVGLFGDVMSAQPSSIVFSFLNENGDARGEIEIYPYAISRAAYEYSQYPELETLLAEQPSLLEYSARNRMPQLPISGVAALFGGAGAYVPFGSGSGLRFITYFAQMGVLFRPDTTFEYLYRGITSDQAFFVTAQNFGVKIPAGTIPANGNLADELYARYLRQFEANLAAQPTNAFTPDLALLDAIFTSLTVTDNEALLQLIP